MHRADHQDSGFKWGGANPPHLFRISEFANGKPEERAVGVSLKKRPGRITRPCLFIHRFSQIVGAARQAQGQVCAAAALGEIAEFAERMSRNLCALGGKSLVLLAEIKTARFAYARAQYIEGRRCARRTISSAASADTEWPRPRAPAECFPNRPGRRWCGPV